MFFFSRADACWFVSAKGNRKKDGAHSAKDKIEYLRCKTKNKLERKNSR